MVEEVMLVVKSKPPDLFWVGRLDWITSIDGLDQALESYFRSIIEADSSPFDFEFFSFHCMLYQKKSTFVVALVLCKI